jgi:hypothetical protein
MFFVGLGCSFVSTFDILTKNFVVIHFLMRYLLFGAFGAYFDLDFHAIEYLSGWDVYGGFDIFLWCGMK